MGVSNAGWFGKNRDLSQYLAPALAVIALTAKCNTLSCKLMTLVAGKWRSLLMAGDDDKMFMTRIINTMPKTIEQH